MPRIVDRMMASAAMPPGLPNTQKLTYRSIPTSQGTLPTAQLGYHYWRLPRPQAPSGPRIVVHFLIAAA